jgi:hypothetical protein
VRATVADDCAKAFRIAQAPPGYPCERQGRTARQNGARNDSGDCLARRFNDAKYDEISGISR